MLISQAACCCQWSNDSAMAHPPTFMRLTRKLLRVAATSLCRSSAMGSLISIVTSFLIIRVFSKLLRHFRKPLGHMSQAMGLMQKSLMLFVVLAPLASSTELKLGLITPLEGQVGFKRTAAASTMAIEQAKIDGFLSDVNVSIIWKNDDCDGKESLGRVVDLWDQEDVDGFFGLPCSVATIAAAKIIAYWNLPLLSYSSVDPVLADKTTYSTLVRLMSPYNRMADAMVELFHYYQWHRVVLVMMHDFDHYCDIAGRAFEERFSQKNVTVADWMRTYDKMTLELIDQWLDKIKITGRIVVICAVDEDLLNFMLRAEEKGMTNGDYVYITPSLWSAENLERRWIIKGINNKDSHRARTAYGSLLQMAMGFMTDPQSIAFMEDVPRKLAEPPWNYHESLENGDMSSPFALFLYDSVYLYAMVANQMINMGISPRNGSLLYELAKQKTFQGKSGIVTLDDNGDRIANYRLWHLPPTTSTYEGLMEIVMTDTTGDRVRIHHQRDWGESGLSPPHDSPPCGFFEELCPKDNKMRDVTVIGVVVFGIFVTAIISGFVIMHNGTKRRKRVEHELELMLWKIRLDELKFVKRTSTGQSIAVTSSTGSVFSSASMSENDLTRGITHLAHHKGSLVAVRILQRTGILLTRQDHLELKLMREINHDNLNGFVGACIDPPYICTMFKYCSKGTLQDILMNEDIKLDQNFRYSFIMDLIHGMEALHRSELASHGYLRSTTCVVDGRWVLKVTDWGPSAFRENTFANDNEKYSAQLTTAPELLRENKNLPRGSQKGDVYSFAIILQEILYRAKPYEAMGSIGLITKDLIGRVRNGETPPFRPLLPPDDKIADDHMIDLMKVCWHEDPACRPDFTIIKTKVGNITNGKRYNILDNVLKMMEKYANNLEDLVGERTRQLEDEKKKTDSLLYKMLPTPIADSLKQGSCIQPEFIDNVTVFFSDVVSFTEMSSYSTPMEVVDFLNDLWTLFDDILEKYDVYKVETIGDAYMVASGLPLKTKTHAAEIASMSLDIMSSIVNFRISHCPDMQLKIRIGIHTGSVVAGVVGQTMPRYCLFGDTVTLAKLMESSGGALRIHVSKETHDELESLGHGYLMKERGLVDIKDIGPQKTYWLTGKVGDTRPLPIPTDMVEVIDLE